MNTNHILASQVKTTTSAIRSPTSPMVVMAVSLVYDAGLPRTEGPIYFRTEANEYDISGKPGYYLLGYIGPRPSNLTITTITLVGPSGVVHAHDEVDTNAAIRLWEKLKASNVIDLSDLGATYVEV